MKFVLVIYHGTAPLPGTPEWESLPEREQQAIYADFGTLNTMENLTPGPPLGLPQNATTVVSHPPRLSIPSASDRLSRSQASWTASSASASDPSIR